MADANVQAAVALIDEAASQVKAATEGGEVDKAVVAALVEERMARRTDLLLNAVKDRKKKVKALAAIKPANKGFTEVGDPIPGDSYTLAQVQQIKGAKEAIAKLDEAINARDFDKLSDLGY